MSTPAERAAAKAAQRAENRRRWESSPKNINHQLAEARSAEVPIPAELLEAGPDDRALSKLAAIMSDQSQPLYRRAEAGIALAPYQVARGQAADAASEVLTSPAYAFLRAVASADRTPPPIRLRVLRALAAAENLPAARTDPTEAAAQRETMRCLINAARRGALRQAGRWQAACINGAAWCLLPSDDFDTPAEIKQAGSAGDGIAMLLDAALALGKEELQRRREMRRATLLAIRAENRDDAWDS
jgi:hypothetical protein